MRQPSIVDELGAVLADYAATRPRSQQKDLGPSELGTPCTQQMARKMIGAPRQPSTLNNPMWAPFQGIAIHRSMEDVLDYWNQQAGTDRFIIERRLILDSDIAGSCDAYDTLHNRVIDWKYVGRTAINKMLKARRQGEPVSTQVKPEYFFQAHLYGYGYEQLGYPVETVAVVMLARDVDYWASAEWTDEYKPAVAERALERYRSLKHALSTLELDAYPARISFVPAVSGEHCRYCPYLRPGRPSDYGGCPGPSEVTTLDTTQDHA